MRTALITLGAFAALAPSLHAQDAEVIEIEEVVVSGGLTSMPEAALGRSVSIITADDLEREGVVYAVDALRGVPGVAVSRTGGRGGATVIRLRGAESNHTQVFIDGVKVSSPDNLDYDFSSLLAADIERIEVLRGPQSALFGANAIGGVISITTKRASEPGFTTSGSVEGGSDESWGGDAAARYRAENFGFSASLARQYTGGYDVSDSPGGHDDSDRNLTVNLAGDVSVSQDLRLGGTFRFVDRRTEFDQFNFAAADHAGLVTDADLVAKRQEYTGSAFGELDSFGGRVQSRASFGYLHFDDDQYEDDAKTTATKGSRQTFRLQSTVALDAPTVSAADHILTGAFDYEREAYRNTDPDLVFDPTQLDRQTRKQYSGALEYRGEYFDAVDIQLALRHDINDDFKDFTTWSASASWRLPTGSTRLHGSVGRGVQNPTLIDQFGFFPGSFIGNPSLKPEKSLGWDIGVEQTFDGGRGVVDVTYFHDRLTDEIESVFDPVTFLSTSENNPGKSYRKGVEIESHYSPNDILTLGVNYTYLDATDFNGAREVRRPKHDVGVTVDLHTPDQRGRFAVDANYVADMRDSDFVAPYVPGRQIKMDDRVVVGVSASYKVTDQVEVYGRVSNLFDENYEEVDGYSTEGRVGFVGLRARW